MKTLATILAFITLVVAVFVLMSASSVSAEPHAQATVTRTPTDEPAKPPYVFPTPIFIPTYPGDTPAAPTVRATPIIQTSGATTYTIVSGDSPWIIAQKVYGDGSKYQLILDANGLTKDSRLRVGAVLQIPALAGTPVATAPANTPTTVATKPIAPSTPLPATSGSPTLAPAIFMTATPLRPSTPGTNTPSTSSVPMTIPFEILDLVPTILNVLSGICGIAGLVCGVLAFLLFNRSRRMEEMNKSKKRLTLRQ
jgi:LysM repeat protein